MSFTVIITAISVGSLLVSAYSLWTATKTLGSAKVLDKQLEFIVGDIDRYHQKGMKDIAYVETLCKAVNTDLTQAGVDLNKRIRKLEQKDGQIQSWINTSVDCFENQQDQIDTLSVLVLGKLTGEKKDG